MLLTYLGQIFSEYSNIIELLVDIVEAGIVVQLNCRVSEVGGTQRHEGLIFVGGVRLRDQRQTAFSKVSGLEVGARGNVLLLSVLTNIRVDKQIRQIADDLAARLGHLTS